MWKSFEMVKQKGPMRITQSGKNCAINCAIQGVCLIWKQKIWLAICEFLWSLTNQNSWFVSSFFTELTLFCTVFKENCTALNQSEWRNFFMQIISYIITYPHHFSFPFFFCISLTILLLFIYIAWSWMSSWWHKLDSKLRHATSGIQHSSKDWSQHPDVPQISQNPCYKLSVMLQWEVVLP